MDTRSTIQRSLVLAAVNAVCGHATADEIYRRITSEYPTVSRGTVYRNLNLLSDMGEIRKVEVPGGADHFEHQSRPHYHVRCVRCGRIFDVDMPFITDLEKDIRDKRGFQFLGHDIVFKGICPECQGEEPQSDVPDDKTGDAHHGV
jgi:Fur family ferric uptake transcriptional regulator/Fur family peroxide stress response transcriptional regulator